MVNELITEKIWSRITSEVKCNPSKCFVAVPFFSKNASDMLPLSKGSVLVVNASKRIVKSGQTNPKELILLYEKGVKIFNCENLHAKVYVIGKKLLIGSSNVSGNSANYLKEVMLLTEDTSTVNQAIKMVKSLKIDDLKFEDLLELKKIYKTPKFIGGMPANKPVVMKGKESSKFYLCNLVYKDYPKGHKDALAKGQETAESLKADPQSRIVDFGWGRRIPFKKGDTILQIIKDDDGQRYVYPHGRVVNIEKWSPNHSLVFLEVANKRKRKIESFTKFMDISKLKRGGYKSISVANIVRKIWNK